MSLDVIGRRCVGGHVVDTSPFPLVGTMMSLGIGLVSMHFRLTP